MPEEQVENEQFEDYSANEPEETETMEAEAPEEEASPQEDQSAPVEESPPPFDVKTWFAGQPPEAQSILTQMHEQVQRLEAMEQARQQPQQGRTSADLSEQEFEQYLSQQWEYQVMPEYFRLMEQDIGKAEWFKAKQIDAFREARHQHRSTRAQRNQYILDQHSQRVTSKIAQDPAYESIRWAQDGIVQEARRASVDPAWLAEQFRMYEEARSQQHGKRKDVADRRRAQAYTEMVDGGAPPSKKDKQPTEKDLTKMWESLVM